MARRKTPKRHLERDYKYNSLKVMRLINYVMNDGKKDLARNIVYKSFGIIEEKTKQEPLEIFAKAEAYVTPRVEVKAKRIGGTNVQVPRELTAKRQFQLFLRWMVQAARERREKSMYERLANEFMEAAKGEGNAAKRKINMDKAAHSHRAYAHLK